MQVHEDVSACPRRGAAPPATVEKALEKTRELWIDLRIFQKHKADRESSRSFQSVLFISFFPFFFFFQGERDLFFLRKHTVPDALYIFSHLIIRLASRYVLSPRSLGGGRRTLRRAAVPRTFHTFCFYAVFSIGPQLFHLKHISSVFGTNPSLSFQITW